MPLFRILIDFYLFKRYRLKSLKLLPLGASLGDAIKLYGEPIESNPSEVTEEITEYTFGAGHYHQVVALVWQGKIHSITYWSMKADPKHDIICMLDGYGEGKKWYTLEQGYWYQRKDDKVRLWCSIAPAIGVAYVDFFCRPSRIQKRVIKHLGIVTAKFPDTLK